MTAAASGSFARPVDAGRPEAASPVLPVGLVRYLAICVASQIALTIALPDQGWSMRLGVAGLCFLAVTTTIQVAARHKEGGRFHTIMVAAFFALKGSAWLVSVTGELGASLSSLLSFVSQFVMIQILVPRGRRYGAVWPATFDIIGGVALCLVMAGRFGSPTAADLWPIAPHYLPYLEYVLYPALAVGSLVVQRRSPSRFLGAFVITICLYALTSIVSLQLSTVFPIASNSPWWIYGDTALILYPLLANAARYRRPTAIETEVGGALNMVVPATFAVAVLAFGYAHYQQTFASLIGAVGLLLYAGRVGFVTRQYHKTQAALVEAGRLRVEALIDVVHELRSPLASVVLNAAALGRVEDVPPALKRRIDTIANRCGTVTRLLNDVLDLERIEAGLMEISVAAVDVRAACRAALDAVATTADAAGVALRGPDDDVPPCLGEGDSALLTRVVVNLLDNAVRFTPAGGVVTVSIAQDGPSHVAVVVEDTGVGVSPDARATLFGRFGHAGEPVNGAKGSGLGLSISSSAVAAMQGRLDLTPRDDGPGTRATIMLKRRAATGVASTVGNGAAIPAECENASCAPTASVRSTTRSSATSHARTRAARRGGSTRRS